MCFLNFQYDFNIVEVLIYHLYVPYVRSVIFSDPDPHVFFLMRIRMRILVPETLTNFFQQPIKRCFLIK
jgi:hypothetical protein